MTISTPELDQITTRACRAVDLDPAGRQLIHHFSNAVFYLPAAGAVARIAARNDDTERIRRSVRTVTALHRQGVPATEPLPDAEVVQIEDATVSFWRYYRQSDAAPPLTPADLGAALRLLHRANAPSEAGLRPWRPLESLRQALTDDQVCRPLERADRAWLAATVDEVCADLAQLSSPLGIGVIHGDAWMGNLMHGEAGQVILCDWDWTCIGPREIDLIPTWHATWRYGKDPAAPGRFAEAYGFDLTEWDGLPVLLAMRDLVQITGPLRRAADSRPHAQALRQRLDGIKSGSSAHWQAL